MKRLICKTHNTTMVIDDKKNRKILIKYENLKCLLPSIREPQESKLGKCRIQEVDNIE